MDRIAIIDLGSNSIRFIVMQIGEQGSYKLIYQEKKSIRLAEGMTQETRLLTEEAQERALKCLTVYAHIIEVQKVKKVLAVATAAVRNAVNGASFLKRVHMTTGISMTIISGRAEAALGFSGVIHTIDRKDFLLFDLGGASVEISLVKNKKRLHSVSIPYGAVTLTEMFQSSGTVSQSKLTEMKKFIQAKLDKITWFPDTPLPVIGVGGTVRNLAKVHQRSTGYPLPKLHNYNLPSEDLFEMVKDITSKTFEERQRISGLSSERADIIIAGALTVQEIIRKAKSSYLTISGCGLREGLFFHYYDPIYDKDGDKRQHMLINSVKNYLHTVTGEYAFHSRYVTALALSMFDQWKHVHGLSSRMRTLLMAAGFLHDAGSMINYYNHARHSAYIAANAHIFGWSQKEQVCALSSVLSTMDSQGNTQKIMMLRRSFLKRKCSTSERQPSSWHLPRDSMKVRNSALPRSSAHLLRMPWISVFTQAGITSTYRPMQQAIFSANLKRSSACPSVSSGSLEAGMPISLSRLRENCNFYIPDELWYT